MVSQTELNTVTPLVVQNTTTSSWLTQFASIIVNAPWPYIGVWVAFVGVIVALALAGVTVALIVHSRKTDAREANAKEPELIFGDEPVVQETLRTPLRAMMKPPLNPGEHGMASRAMQRVIY
jgi:hypothetical protein